MFAFIIGLGGCALNTVLYVDDPNPWSLGGAIFCGGLAVFNLLAEATR